MTSGRCHRLKLLGYCHVAVIVLAGPLHAQLQLEEPWRWAWFGPGSGLPSMHVADVVETLAGTTWAATSAGPAWFDSYQWHKVTGLPDSLRRAPRAMTVASPDDLLALIEGHVYHITRDSATRIPLVFNGEDLEITMIVNDLNTGLFFVSGEALFTISDGAVIPVPTPSPVRMDERANIYLTKSGNLYINAHDGLYKREGDHWKLMMRPSRSSFRIADLSEDDKGNGIVSIDAPRAERGLWEWTADGSPVFLKESGSEVMFQMDFSRSGELAGRYEAGTVRFRSDGVWSTVLHPPSRLRDILFLRFRSNGDLWTGGESGINLFRRSSNRWQYWRHDFPDERNTIHEILRSRDGSVWIATFDGLEIHRPGGRIDRVESAAGLSLNGLTGLGEDSSGNVWVSSGSSITGALRWDGVRWRHFGVNDGLSAQRVHKIVKDRLGRLWFLGLGGDESNPASEPGAFLYTGGRFIRWGVAQGLPSGRVYAFSQGGDGALWFGTLAGLSRLKDSTWTHWRHSSGLKEERIFTIATDGAHNVWFSDRENGLGYIDDHGVPKFLTTADGLINNEVWDIKVDEGGRVWIATKGGLSLYDQGIWSSFGTSAGLSSLRLWPLLATRDFLYIGTIGNGVDILSLKELFGPSPRLTILDPVVEKSTALLRWQEFPFGGGIAGGQTLTRYRLDKGSWSAWGTVRELTLGNLMPGEHAFHVQARDLFGTFEPAGRRVGFVVEPPIYRRLFFLLPLGTLMVALSAVTVSYRKRRKRHESALRESEEKYRQLFAGNPLPLIVFDPASLAILAVNGAAERCYGYSADEFITRTINDLPSTVDRTVFVDAFGDFIPGRLIAGTFRHRRKDGMEFDVEITPHEFHLEARPVRVMVVNDITERRRAEEALRGNEERYRALFEDSPIALMELDFSGIKEHFQALKDRGVRDFRKYFALRKGEFNECLQRIRSLDVNKMTQELYGAATKEELLRGVPTISHPGGFAANIDSMVAMAEGKLRYTGEWPSRTLAGETIFINMTWSVAPGHEATYDKVFLSMIDVTERKRAEERLRLSEERLKLALVAARMNTWEWNVNTNRRTLNIPVGSSLETLAPPLDENFDSFLTFVHDGDRSALFRSIVRALEDEAAMNRFETEFRLVGPNRGVQWLYGTGLVVRDDAGCPLKLVGVSVDITERKQGEYRLAKLNECLVSFGPDVSENINRLVSLCGEQLGATTALYNRMDNGKLCSWGTWHTPPDYPIVDSPQGHICYDVIRGKHKGVCVLRNLQDTEYATSDPNVALYGLKTYIGKAVLFAGSAVGSLCVVYQDDHVPIEGEMKLLEIVASAIAVEEKRNRAEQALRESEARLKAVMENLPFDIWACDPEGKYIIQNSTSISLWGDLLGKRAEDIDIPGNIRARWSVNREEAYAGKVVRGEAAYERNGDLRAYDSVVAPIRVGSEVRGILGVNIDITDRKEAEEQIKASLLEKEVLLKEIHHRVKNNLQIISSLLNLQSEYIRDPRAYTMFRESQHRVRSMALIHERLYRSKDLSRIDAADYVSTLTTNLFRSYGGDEKGIDMQIDVEPLSFNIDAAIPVGLIINELVSNALKYAFPDRGAAGSGQQKRIVVCIRKENDTTTGLIVRDNGIGFPASLDFSNTATLGMQLVVTLTKQLQGTIRLERVDGSAFIISFPTA